MKKRFISLSVMLFMGMQLLFAQQVEQPQFVSSTEGIKEYSLTNGMQVLLIPDASQSNTVVNIVYRVGSKHEGYGETGMAHLLEHMLFKSTKNLGDIKKMLSEKAATANGTTFYDRTNYYEVFPYSEENLQWSLEMEADRMINATLLQEDLDTEFSVVRNEFEMGENNPYRVLMQKIQSTAYMWHNYGRSTIGSKEDVERVTVRQLRPFYEKYYQPDNATLMVAGKFDEAKTLQDIAKYFAPIPRPERQLEEIITVEPPQDGEKYVEVRRAGDVPLLGYMYHSASFADKDFAALSALSQILTSNPSGYLYKSLVDTRLITSIHSFAMPLRDAGYFSIGVNFDKEKDLEEMKTLVRGELNKIPTLEYNEEDLNRAKTTLLNSIENVKNNTIGFAINLTEVVASGDYRLGFLYRDNVEKLTLEDINRVAKKYFRANNLTVGVFIPSADEERVRPAEFNNRDIAELVANYQGKEATETKEFEASIANLKKNYTEGVLTNGMKYGVINKEIKGEKVLASFEFPVSNEQDLAGKDAVATMMSRLILSGTKEMTKEQIVDKLKELKSSINFGFNNQKFSISVSSYQPQFEEVMTLLKQLITEATFPDHELQKMIDGTVTSLESNKTDPQTVANEKLTQLVQKYPKESIFYRPTLDERIEAYKKVTQADILSFYTTILGANQGLGTVIGLSDAKMVGSLLEATFAQWNSQSPYVKALPTFFETTEIDEKVITPDKENAMAMGMMSLSMNKKDADYPALLMANEMLGSGGFLSSRISVRLREKEGISYGAGSSLNVPSVDHKVGSLFFYAMLNPTMRDKVEEALKEEIALALKDGFTEKEFTDNVGSWKNGRTAALGSDGSLIGLSNSYLRDNISFDEWDELTAKVDKLTVQQVFEVFKKYVSLGKLTMVYAGDFDKK